MYNYIQVNRKRELSEGEQLLRKARSAQWGYISLPRGRVLCMRLNKEQVVLVEPGGGYFYPCEEPFEPTPMPDLHTIAATLAGLTTQRLEALAYFCDEPRTMDEVESQFKGIQAWRLRRVGFLRDVGRRNRKIVSQWAGYTLEGLIIKVFHLAETGSRQVNS